MKTSKKMFCLFFSGFICSSLWAVNPDLRPPGTDFLVERYSNFSGGMEDHLSSLLAQNAKNISNFQLNDRGQLAMRSGYAVNALIGSTSSAVTGGSYHTAQTGTSFFTVIVGTGIYRTTNAFGGTYTDVTNGMTLTSAATNLAQGASLNDYKVMCNELDAPLKVSASASAALLTGGPQIGKTCAEFNNYLFFGNTKESGTTYPNRIRWSDINTVDSWPANNYIDLEPNDGDSIICIKPAWRQLMVFKKRTIYSVTITGLSGANAFIARPITRNLGCWAKNSVQVIDDHGVFFQGPNGVYQISGFNYFGLPIINLISDPIFNEFNKIVRTNYNQSVSGVFRKYSQYWLSISTSGSTNSEILVYDYLVGEKNEFKAWSTYSGINANMLSSAEDSGQNEILLTGDYGGYVYKQDVGTSDNPGGVSTAINFSYTSQDMALGSADLNKSIKYLYTFFNSSVSTTTLTMNLAYDFNLSYADTFSSIIGVSAALWGTAIWGTDIWPIANYGIVRKEIGRSGIKTYRVQFTGNSAKTTKVTILGYAVVYKPESWSE